MTATIPPIPDRGDPLAFLPRQDRHKPKCGPVKKSKVGKWRALSLVLVHVAVAIHVWHWLATGKTLSPVEPSEAMQTIEAGRINAGFLLFCALIASTLVFGRWFCGWACHIVALQDLCAWLLGKLGLKPRPVRSRLLVFAPWVVAGHMFAWPVVEAWLWPKTKQLPAIGDWNLEPYTDDLWRTFPGPIMAIATVVVVGFLIVWWLGAKGFCTHGCPYGAFFATADRFSPVRIKVTDACDACGHCTSVCTSNVRVHEEVARHKQLVDPGCMKCLDCVSVCPKDALYVGFALPKPFAVSQQRVVARADFSWPEEFLLAVVAVVTTQWVWRGAWFGEGIPWLLAVGLGVITAVFTLLAVRLLRRRDVTFQHSALKAAGRFTRFGRWVLLGTLAWSLLALHTGLGHWRRESLFAAMKAIRPDAPRSAVEDLLARADSALAWDVFDDPFAREMRGMLRWRLGREADGAADLLAAFEAKGHLDMDVANLNLAMSCLPPRGNRLDVAEAAVRNVLRFSPQHPMATRMLQQIESMKRQ